MEFAGSNYPVEEEGEKKKPRPGSCLLLLLLERHWGFEVVGTKFCPIFPLVVFWGFFQCSTRIQGCPAPTEVSEGDALLPLPAGFPHSSPCAQHSWGWIYPQATGLVWRGEGKGNTPSSSSSSALQGHPSELSAQHIPLPKHTSDSSSSFPADSCSPCLTDPLGKGSWGSCLPGELH